MANELLLHIPFDETGGNTAQDVTGNNDDLTVSNGDWVKGKFNNAIYFENEGFAEVIGTSVIDFSKDYTLSFWFKADIIAEFPQNTWLIYNFSEGNFLYIDAKTAATNWTYFVIMQEGHSLKMFQNGNLCGVENFPDGWGIPTGFCLLNDNPSDGAGFCTMDELKIFDGINVGAIKPPSAIMDILYRIDGINFKDYGVRVEASRGMFDAPEIKQPFVVDWQDYHGDVIDLNNVRYKAKTIELDCWLYANGPDDFVMKCTNFINLFYGSGTKRLHFENGSQVFVYEIYLATGLKIEKRWRPSEMVGKFKLVLNEPQPIKRVVLFIRTSGNTTASITINSQKLCTIYWGDGTKTDNVHGSVTKTHTYASNGQYYIIVAGVVEEFSTFTTNGIIQNGANSFV